MSATRQRILDSAQALVQQRGFSAFSYADISSELSISKPSVHHHFPAKADLGRELVVRYRERFDAARANRDDEAAVPRARLLAYSSIYAEVFSPGGRMCLCGMFAADAASLPKDVRELVEAFFVDQRMFIAEILTSGGIPGSKAKRRAEALLAGLEGALLLARAASGSPEVSRSVGRVAETLIDGLLRD